MPGESTFAATTGAAAAGASDASTNDDAAGTAPGRGVSAVLVKTVSLRGAAVGDSVGDGGTTSLLAAAVGGPGESEAVLSLGTAVNVGSSTTEVNVGEPPLLGRCINTGAHGEMIGKRRARAGHRHRGRHRPRTPRVSKCGTVQPTCSACR